MATLNELLGQRDKLLAEAEELHATIEAERRDMTSEEMERSETLLSQRTRLQAQIDSKDKLRRERELAAAEARGASVGRDHANLSGPLDESGRHGPSVGHEERSGYGFSGLGEVLQALAHERRGAGTDSRLRPLEKRAINEGLSSGGGVWIPEQFVDTVFATSPMAAPLTTGATRIDMVTQKVLVPGWVDDSHSASAPYGITWRQVPESGTFGTVQSLSAKAVPLEAKKSGAYFSISNEWLADSSANARAMVERIFTSSLQWYLEKCCWAGTGAGMALGVLNSGSLLDLDKENLQAADSIITQNVVKMRSRIMPGTYGRCFWACNPTVWPQLAMLTIASGAGGSSVGLVSYSSGIAGEPPQTLLGRPLVEIEHLPVLGDKGDLCLVDPTMYLIGQRLGVVVDASPHARHEYDESCFRVSARFDGSPLRSTTLTLADGATTVSWAVCIKARA